MLFGRWLGPTAMSTCLTTGLLPQDGYNKQITYRNGETTQWLPAAALLLLLTTLLAALLLLLLPAPGQCESRAVLAPVLSLQAGLLFSMLPTAYAAVAVQVGPLPGCTWTTS